MGDISKHFSRKEHKCPCCDWDSVDKELNEILEDLREKFDSPITITSGNRCKEHNKKVGGSKNSQHALGKAVDFKVRGFTPKDVYNYLVSKYHDKYGTGLYSSWIHLDVREKSTAWVD